MIRPHSTRLLIVIALATQILAAPAAADAPVEELYVALEEVPVAILEESIGVLTVFNMYGDSAEFYAKEMWKQSWWLKDREVTTYRRSQEGFTEDGKVGFTAMVAFSGWDFSHQVLRRFPIVQTDGEFLLVVHDVGRDLRAWLSRSELDQLPALPGESIRFSETFFDGRPVEQDMISLFVLLTKEDGRTPGRKVYARPEVGAPVRIVRDTWDDLGYGNTTLTECRNGFARIFLVNPCGEGPDRELGWVRIRDDHGLLKLWCWTGLSC